MICLIDSIIVVGSPLGPMTCLNIGSDSVMAPGMCCTLWSGPSNQSKSSCYSHDVHATIAPVGMPCQAIH